MKLHIAKSVCISSSPIKVYDVISDLSKWNIWSPWMHDEPTAKTEYRGSAGQPGQSLSWNGEVIGSGKMTILSLQRNQQVEMQIEFFTPWKSVAQVIFDVNGKSAEQTEITWTMNSTLPIFMFFFKNMMKAYIGNDFSRGLNMLKEYVETGAVISESIYQGEKEFPGFQVLGKRNSTSISNMGPSIRGDFDQMDALLKAGKLQQPEFIVTLSHDHNIPKGISDYTAGYAYKLNDNVKTPEGFELIKIPTHKAIAVEHFGPYRNLANPWSMLVAYQRGKKKKVNKKIPMHEIYKTLPGGNEKDIQTQIIMPIK